MFSANSGSLTALLLCASAFGQSATLANQTFHVRGTIMDQSGAVIPKAKVAFQNTQFDKTVTTNERGVYEVDLPFGEYTMTAQVVGFKPYRRPLFRVTQTETIAFDFTLPVQPTCDLTVVRTDGGTVTHEDWEAAKKQFCLRCRGELSWNSPQLETGDENSHLWRGCAGIALRRAIVRGRA